MISRVSCYCCFLSFSLSRCLSLFFFLSIWHCFFFWWIAFVGPEGNSKNGNSNNNKQRGENKYHHALGVERNREIWNTSKLYACCWYFYAFFVCCLGSKLYNKMGKNWLVIHFILSFSFGFVLIYAEPLLNTTANSSKCENTKSKKLAA